MLRTRLIAAAGVLATLLIVGAGAVLAQSADDGAATSFLDRVAQKLGIDRAKLDDAIRDVRTEEIDEAVERGDLSEEQAERLKERIAEDPLDGHFGFGPGPKGDHPFGRPFPAFGGFAGAHEQLAEFLGVTVEDLRTELSADGATLASVAEAHGKDRDELKRFLHDQAKKRLDEAVAAGGLAQERADAILAKLDEGADALIDAPGFKCLGGGLHFRFERRHRAAPLDVPGVPQRGRSPATPRT